MKKYAHGEFSSEKLNAIEKDLNRMYGRYKKLSVITPATIIFAVITFGIGNSFALRYMKCLGEYLYDSIDYSDFFLFADLQRFFDRFCFGEDGTLKSFAPALAFLTMVIISLIVSIIFITLVNLIKNIVVKVKPIKPLPDNDTVKKIKTLIKRAKDIDFYEGGLINGRYSVVKELGLVLLADVISIAVLVRFGLWTGSVAEVTFFAGLCFIVLLVVTPIPFFLYYNFGIVGCNQKFGKYNKKVYCIEKVLDNWWVEIDRNERIRREKARENISVYTPTYSFTETKTTSDVPEYGPYGTATNAGMPGRDGLPVHIDVSDM